jgi:hypothetical protein
VKRTVIDNISTSASDRNAALDRYAPKVVHVAWYSPEAWERLAAMPEAQITKSYSDFVRTFETAKRELAARGARIEKMVFDVAAITEMVEWCHRHGYEIDTRGRAAFGAVRAMSGLSAPLVDKTRSVQ